MDDPNVGARIGSAAIRRAMQREVTTGEGACGRAPQLASGSTSLPTGRGRFATPFFLSYDSNTGSVQPHKPQPYVEGVRCPHFPISQIGDPAFNRL